MTREKHDRFAKALLRTVLEPIGTTVAGIEIPGESLAVDVAFEASQTLTPEELALYGLPGRLIAPMALFEPYRHSLELDHLLSGAAKHGWSQLAARRKVASARELIPVPLWVVTPSSPEKLLTDFGLRPAYTVHEQGRHDDWWVRGTWPEGVYQVGKLQPLGVIVLNELPEVRETLTLRLLGRGKTLRRAIEEVRALPADDPLRTPVLHLLIKWRIIEIEAPPLEPEEQEAEMLAQLTYEEWARNIGEESEQRGIEKGIEKGQLVAFREALKRFWQRRFGPVPSTVQERLASSESASALEAAVDVLAVARSGSEAEVALLQALQEPAR